MLSRVEKLAARRIKPILRGARVKKQTIHAKISRFGTIKV